jgi:hypothetical protein
VLVQKYYPWETKGGKIRHGTTLSVLVPASVREKGRSGLTLGSSLKLHPRSALLPSSSGHCGVLP